ncbi:MFS sugar transporter [Penicillium lividum]|nr:MFS sugar transporter [Penicillium lividum]
MWWQKSHLLKLNATIAGLLLYSSTVCYDVSLMNGLQPLDQWQGFMNYPTRAWLGFINAVQFLGVIFGFPFQAWAANRFGRKPNLFVGYFFLAIGAGLQAGAKDPAMFIVARLIIGQASAWFQIAIILITEVAYLSHRSKVSASYQCIPLLALPFAIMSPESPRWLISRDRHEEARQILVHYWAGGDESSLLVLTQMDEMASSIAAERKAQTSTRWVDMVKTSGNRRHFIISVTLGVFAQWNGIGIVSYYLTLILDTIGITSVTDQLMINGFLQIWNLIMAVVGALLVDRVGRRSLFLLSTAIMLVSYIVITGLAGGFAATKSSPVGAAVIPFLFIYYAGYDIAFTPLVMAYPAEIWQYSLRAKGVALTSSCTYLAPLFNSFVNPIAMDAIHWKYYIVYIVLLALILVCVYLVYPETRGHSLENMAAIFDGEGTSYYPGAKIVKRDIPEVDHIECHAAEH